MYWVYIGNGLKYSFVANSHNLQSNMVPNKSSQYSVLSLAVAW
jgi:hypothetical protein